MKRSLFTVLKVYICVRLVQFVIGFEEYPDDWKSDGEIVSCMKKCRIGKDKDKDKDKSRDSKEKRVCNIFGRWDETCHHKCEGVPTRNDSLCECVDRCSKEKETDICSISGIVRRNDCELKCFEEKKVADHICDCAHSCRFEEYKKICGADGNIYFNQCSMGCRGVKASPNASSCQK